MHDYGLLTLGGEEDDGDEDGAPVSDGERPAVVDRDHLQWAAVDAEQRERTQDLE